MNKKLLKQIVNERRSNSWLFIELLLVSIVLWYVVDYMFVTLYTYFEPRGFDIENTYRVEFDYLTEKSPDYIANRTDEEAHADMRELLDRLRRRPGVEAVKYVCKILSRTTEVTVGWTYAWIPWRASTTSVVG